VFVPVPIIKSPVVVIGLKLLNAVAAVFPAVPPAAIGSVPAAKADEDVE